MSCFKLLCWRAFAIDFFSASDTCLSMTYFLCKRFKRDTAFDSDLFHYVHFLIYMIPFCTIYPVIFNPYFFCRIYTNSLIQTARFLNYYSRPYSDYVHLSVDLYLSWYTCPIFHSEVLSTVYILLSSGNTDIIHIVSFTSYKRRFYHSHFNHFFNVSNYTGFGCIPSPLVFFLFPDFFS